MFNRLLCRNVEEQVIAKSTIVLDVKPWDDETDIDAMEKAVRSIEADGLVWGQCQAKVILFVHSINAFSTFSQTIARCLRSEKATNRLCC
jgi:hypothetical protein